MSSEYWKFEKLEVFSVYYTLSLKTGSIQKEAELRITVDDKGQEHFLYGLKGNAIHSLFNGSTLKKLTSEQLRKYIWEDVKFRKFPEDELTLLLEDFHSRRCSQILNQQVQSEEEHQEDEFLYGCSSNS